MYPSSSLAQHAVAGDCTWHPSPLHNTAAEGLQPQLTYARATYGMKRNPEAETAWPLAQDARPVKRPHTDKQQLFPQQETSSDAQRQWLLEEQLRQEQRKNQELLCYIKAISASHPANNNGGSHGSRSSCAASGNNAGPAAASPAAAAAARAWSPKQQQIHTDTAAAAAAAAAAARSSASAAAAQNSRLKMLRTSKQASSTNRSSGLVFGKARLTAAAAGKAADPCDEQLAALLENVSNEELSQAIQQALILQLQRQQQQPGQQHHQQQQPRWNSLNIGGNLRRAAARTPSHVPISACVKSTSSAGNAAGKQQLQQQQRQQADAARAINRSNTGRKQAPAAALTAAAAAAQGHGQAQASPHQHQLQQQSQLPSIQQHLLPPAMMQAQQYAPPLLLQQQQQMPAMQAAPLAHSPDNSSDWRGDSVAPVSSSCSAAPCAIAAVEWPVAAADQAAGCELTGAFDLPAVPSDLVSHLSLNANCDDLLALLEELEGAE